MHLALGGGGRVLAELFDTGGEEMAGGADLLGHVAETRVPKGSIPRWVERYGYGTRQIKNWLALGREAGELPPFEDPAQMEAWAGRHLGKVPGRLLEAIARLTGGEEKKPETEPFEVPDISGDALGVEADLHRFRRSLALAHRMHDDALKAGKLTEASRYMEQARTISAEVRQLEKLLPAVKEAAGEWLRTAETKKATMEFLTVLYRALLGRGAKAAPALRTAGSSDADLVKTWKDEIAGVFRECCAADFREGLELE